MTHRTRDSKGKETPSGRENLPYAAGANVEGEERARERLRQRENCGPFPIKTLALPALGRGEQSQATEGWRAIAQLGLVTAGLGES